MKHRMLGFLEAWCNEYSGMGCSDDTVMRVYYGTAVFLASNSVTGCQ